MDTSQSKSRYVIAGAIAIVAVVLDQLTKFWALSALADDTHPIPIIGSLLSFQLLHNSGAAFSLGETSTWVFTVLSVVIIGILIVGLSRSVHVSAAACLGLLGGGAIDNLIDRLIQPPGIDVGHVVDFINYNGFFVGNVADIWIVVGAIWLAWEFSRDGAFAGEDNADDAPVVNSLGDEAAHE